MDVAVYVTDFTDVAGFDAFVVVGPVARIAAFAAFTLPHTFGYTLGVYTCSSTRLRYRIVG